MHICKIYNQPMVDYNHLRIHKIDLKTYFDLYFKTLEKLDFYFPELNIAIEYDGTYHHADKRFYSPHDIIKLKHCTAQDIWLKDEHKNQYCDILGIKLLRIAEYDWENNTDVIKNQIKLFLGLM